jgi:3-oxoacyl-[acyl-carrier protein] reductase
VTAVEQQEELRTLVEAPNARRLEGAVAVVTGAAHGIGKAHARRLAAEGATVVLADLDGAAAERAAAEFEAAGLSAVGIQTDISDAAKVDQMVEAVTERFGRIDVLVNNAAMFSVVPMSREGFDKLSEDEWDRMMAVNLRGVWLCCKAVAPVMREQGRGKIVNISSGTALKGSASRIHYVTSKAGILGFTKSLARELGPDGITVNCVAPGSTLSEENPTEETVALRSERVADRAIKRVQYAADLVGAVAFFASPDSDFVTGQTLVVDGGVVMP